jgi:hypothetical protein
VVFGANIGELTLTRKIGVAREKGEPMTALEYMEKQVQKHKLILARENARCAPLEVLQNLRGKISYYEQAVEALRMEDILLNGSGENDFDYNAED